MNKRYSVILYLFCGFSTYSVSADDIEISGFARVVAGYLDESNADYLGYSDKVSLTQQSLVGLQGDWQLSSQVSITGQFLLHANEQRKSGLEWLYLTYQPNNTLRIKLGKLRTPFFSYSEYIDVGFAYPWITAPQTDYSIFTTYEGINASLRHVFDGIQINLESYYGQYKGDIFVADTIFDKARADDLHGVIGKVIHNNLEFRLAWHKTIAGTTEPELEFFASQLRQIGFSQTADSLSTQGPMEVTQLSISKESLDYFARFELSHSQSKVLTNPNVTTYYFTAGIYQGNFVHYISYITFRNNYPTPVNEILDNVSPELDAVAAAYRNIFSSLPKDDLDKYVVGSRWDIQTGLALKAEVAWLNGNTNQRSLFQIKNADDFDRKAVLYQLSLEWVF